MTTENDEPIPCDIRGCVAPAVWRGWTDDDSETVDLCDRHQHSDPADAEMTRPDAYRDTQLSLIEGRERPVGPILQSVFTGRTNAELMRAVAPLYLTGSVLDVTYGRGKWWDRFRPDPFAWHDLELDGVDCRTLPEADDSWDTVTFDPPYVESGGQGKIQGSDYFAAYGIGCGCRLGSIPALIADGTREACRVARRFVLVKCMEYVGGGSKFTDGPTVATLAAREVGWTKHDQIVHFTGGGPGGAHMIRKVLRAQRAHSYLLVFAP